MCFLMSLSACLSVSSGFCLALACLLFPDSWESPEMRALCGDSVSVNMASVCDTSGGRSTWILYLILSTSLKVQVTCGSLSRWAVSLQVTVPCTGPTSWPSWGSWTLPSWLRWHLSSPTDRTPCCRQTLRRVRMVHLGGLVSIELALGTVSLELVYFRLLGLGLAFESC